MCRSDTGYRRSAGSDEVCPVFEGKHLSRDPNRDRNLGTASSLTQCVTYICAEIGQKWGPFDVSLIPIWRGGTLGFISWAGLRVSDVDTRTVSS